MKYSKPAAIAALLCAVANPVWSGVPHGIQRTETSQRTDMSVTQASAAKPSGNDECARMASLENEIASLRSRVDEMLAQLRTRDADRK